MLEKMIRTQTAQKEKQLDEWMQRHDAAHPFPSETVELTPDLAYAPENYAKIDVFRPKADFPQSLPVIVDLHGGGFLLGRKEANRLYCADLAAQGFLVYCPEYPLAPEHNLFEILQALSRALDAAAARIPGDGGDLNRVFLCGDSAGAWLCVYLAAMQRSAFAGGGRCPLFPACPRAGAGQRHVLHHETRPNRFVSAADALRQGLAQAPFPPVHESGTPGNCQPSAARDASHGAR